MKFKIKLFLLFISMLCFDMHPSNEVIVNGVVVDRGGPEAIDNRQPEQESELSKYTHVFLGVTLNTSSFMIDVLNIALTFIVVSNNMPYNFREIYLRTAIPNMFIKSGLMLYLFLEHKKYKTDCMKFYIVLRFIGLLMTIGQVSNVAPKDSCYNDDPKCYIPDICVTVVAILAALVHVGHFGYHNWTKYI